MVNPRDIAGKSEEEKKNGELRRYSWGTQKKNKNGEPRDIAGERRRRMVNPRDIAGNADSRREEEW